MMGTKGHEPSTSQAPRERRRLGEILVADGAITAEELTRALAEQASLGLPLGQTLLQLGFTTDEVMRQALSSQLGVPYINLQNVIIDRSLSTVVDRDFARQHALFPVARIGRTMTVAMDDPTQSSVVEELAATTGHAISVVTSSAEAIQRALVRLYEKAPARPQSAETAAQPGSTAPVALLGGSHGYVALLGLMTVELPDLLRSIEGGLPFRVFEEFVERTGLATEHVAAFADVSIATLGRRRDEGRFTRDESDRLVRAARVFGRVLTLFAGDRVTTTAWLMSGQPALRGSVPVELARTDLGAREVEHAIDSLTRSNR